MPWKYSGRVIRVGRSWTDNNNITHPYNWNEWSEDYKAEMGLTWEADPAPYDNRFYWDADTPKALDDVNEVDEDGNAVLDENGDQLVTLGLKSVWKAIIKDQAGGLLQPTDWMVVKASEVSDYSLPSAVATDRAAIRTASNTIEASIDGAADHAAFMALFNAPTDSDGNVTGNAPIADWP
jgi:hypothetical protein